MTRVFTLLLAGLLAWQTALAAEQSVSLDDGNELPYQELQAASRIRYLLLPLEFGMHETNIQLGQAMQKAGLDTWVVDLFAPGFLPITAASMNEVPGSYVATIIRHALQRDDKDVVLVAVGHGAIPALRGGRLWLQQGQAQQRFKGLLLLHPSLYTHTPEAGEAPEYVPEARANQLPIYLLSPTQSPSRWRIMEDARVLAQHGAEVFVKLLPGVRNYYFRNPEPSAVEARMTAQFPADLQQGARLLANLPPQPITTVAALPPQTRPQAARIRGIEEYAGTPAAPELSFADTRGQQHTLSHYRGKVVLLNFWATWCPPCVHEMPSMDRLQHSLQGEPFTILAVNMAEEESVVRTFLQRDVKVDFPVLLDSKGVALKDWSVFVYPTSYIIDKQGRIRAAMYGAIDWDSDEVRARLRALMQE